MSSPAARDDELGAWLTPDTDVPGLGTGERAKGVLHADLPGDAPGLVLLLIGGKCAAVGGRLRGDGDGANNASLGSALNGGETWILWFDGDCDGEGRGIGRPLRDCAADVRGGDEGAEDTGEGDRAGDARRAAGTVSSSSSKSPSKTPSSIA